MCKNAADEKLRLSMRRFADLHGSPAAVVLVSGDVNFASDLCDIRHRYIIIVIIIFIYSKIVIKHLKFIFQKKNACYIIA